MSVATAAPQPLRSDGIATLRLKGFEAVESTEASKLNAADAVDRVRIPAQADHLFRTKPISDSTPSRSVIPGQADHLFHAQADHFRPLEWNRA